MWYSHLLTLREKKYTYISKAFYMCTKEPPLRSPERLSISFVTLYQIFQEHICYLEHPFNNILLMERFETLCNIKVEFDYSTWVDPSTKLLNLQCQTKFKQSVLLSESARFVFHRV